MKLIITPSGTSEPGREYRKNMRPLAKLLASGITLAFAIMSVPQAHAGQAETSVALVSATSEVPERKHHPRDNTFMKRQWGVEVLFVRQTSAGYMLEFRYKILDADKAKPLFERQTKPLLTHARTGAKLIVPTPAKTGALRNSNSPHSGTTYWMFFANPGKLVQPGDKVNIAIGKFHADGLVVQ